MTEITKEQAVQLARNMKFTEPQPYDYGAERDRFILTHDDLERFAQAAYTLGRDAGLEEAAHVCDYENTAMHDKMAEAFRILKDNT